MYQVSITSHRPGLTPLDAQTGRDAWVIALGLAGIQEFDVQLGIGGWEGGREPTFVTRIRGGELWRVLAAAARLAFVMGQDNTFVLDYTVNNPEDPRTEPAHEIGFVTRLTTSQMRVVERALGSVGIGGWTWSKQEGRSLLQIVFIPEWSEYTRDGHYDRVAAISTALARAGIEHTVGLTWADRYLFSPENYRKYIPW